MKPSVLIAGLAALALSAGAAAAQEVRSLEAGAQPAAVTLDDFKGLQGQWAGPTAAASFSQPMLGEIVGYLLLGNDQGGMRVQEYWALKQEGNSVLIRQKHYTSEFKDREDHDAWGQRKVVAVDKDAIYLENLTWKTGGDTLELVVRIPGQNGAAPTMLRFPMKRVK